MLEVIVSASIAVVAGLSAVTTQLHRRIHNLDNRIDDISLKVAENYVTRNELSETFKRFEDHLIRIENKMDTLSTKT